MQDECKVTRVVVTGGGVSGPLLSRGHTENWPLTSVQPFKEWRINPSAMIKDALPENLTVSKNHTIEIFKYTEDVVSTYDFVLRMVPQVWSGQRHLYRPRSNVDEAPIHVDLVLHIGLNPDHDGFSLETRARRHGYDQPGEDGVRLPSSALEGMPSELRPSFDLEVVKTQVATRVPVSDAVPPSMFPRCPATVLTSSRNRLPYGCLTMQAFTSVNCSCIFHLLISVKRISRNTRSSCTFHRGATRLRLSGVCRLHRPFSLSLLQICGLKRLACDPRMDGWTSQGIILACMI